MWVLVGGEAELRIRAVTDKKNMADHNVLYLQRTIGTSNGTSKQEADIVY